MSGPFGTCFDGAQEQLFCPFSLSWHKGLPGRLVDAGQGNAPDAGGMKRYRVRAARTANMVLW